MLPWSRFKLLSPGGERRYDDQMTGTGQSVGCKNIDALTLDARFQVQRNDCIFHLTNDPRSSYSATPKMSKIGPYQRNKEISVESGEDR